MVSVFGILCNVLLQREKSAQKFKIPKSATGLKAKTIAVSLIYFILFLRFRGLIVARLHAADVSKIPGT